MAMRIFVVVLVFFLSTVLCNDCNTQQYYYNNNKFDLTVLALPVGSYAYSYLDKDTDRQWYWNTCGSVNGLLDVNGEVITTSDYASAIFKNYTGGTYVTAGSQYSTSMNIMPGGSGVSVTFRNGDGCDSGGVIYLRNVTLQFFCDNATFTPIVTSIASAECFDVISVQTISACPTKVWTTIPSLGSSTGIYSGRYLALILAIVLVAGGACCICAACMCHRRNRTCRSQCKKVPACNNKYEMQNVSFQPLPQSDTSFVTPNSMPTNLQPQQVQFLPPQMMAPQQNQMPQQYPYVYMQQPQYYYMPVQGQQPFVAQEQVQPVANP